MERREDWEQRLFGFLEAAKGRRFEYGGHDCGLFACACVKEMTGEDMAGPALRKRWREARRTTTQAGAFAADLERIAEGVAARCGMAAVPATLARRGDVALVDNPSGPWKYALGIVVGAHVAVAAGTGFAVLPMARAVRCWRVG